jgi:nitrogen regulatory protein P-II 1
MVVIKMKEITSYIRHDKADIVIEKLEEAGVKGMTLLDANALAEWADSEAFSLSIEYVQKYSKVIKIELICNADKSGDGRIFVTPFEKAVRIKTGDLNDFQNL